MTHSQAITVIIERLSRQFPLCKIYREKTFNAKPKIIPDISIDLDSGKKWIVVEVGTTQASKIALYQQDPTIEKFLWYDHHSLKLVGIWDFTKQKQEITVEQELIDKSAEAGRIGEIAQKTKYRIRQLEKAHRATKKSLEQENAESYAFFQNDKLRVLCPICLSPVSFANSRPWFKSVSPYGMLVCKSCKWEPDFDPIDRKEGLHGVVELWRIFIRLLRENALKTFSLDDTEETLRKGFNTIPPNKSKRQCFTWNIKWIPRKLPQ